MDSRRSADAWRLLLQAYFRGEGYASIYGHSRQVIYLTKNHLGSHPQRETNRTTICGFEESDEQEVMEQPCHQKSSSGNRGRKPQPIPQDTLDLESRLENWIPDVRLGERRSSSHRPANRNRLRWRSRYTGNRFIRQLSHSGTQEGQDSA